MVSAGVGLVPIAGDIALAVWKANSRNAKLLELHLRKIGQENISNGLSGLTPDTSAPAHPNPNTATTPNHASNAAGGAPSVASTSEQTRVVDPATGKKKWFGGKK